MKLIEIKDKEKYNSFIANQEHSQFLQSWEWGEFNEVRSEKLEAKNIKRLGIKENEKLIMVLTLVKKYLGLGKSYWYCPRVNFQFLIFNSQTIFNFLISELEKIAKQENIIFLRFEPVNFTPQSPLLIRRGEVSDSERGEVKKTIDVQPSKTLILDISKSEEEILKNFKQKTRYNIRLAKKKGVLTRLVETRRGASQKDFEDWWKIMEETKNRDDFRLHSKDYYRKMIFGDKLNFKSEILKTKQIQNSKLEIDSKFKIRNLKLTLFLAEYDGKIIAGNIVAFFGDMATYVHGASSNRFRNVMAPYLLQWESMKIAKEMGCKYYDFNGIDENKWPGVTRFKRGFGGDEVQYPGTFDLVFNSKWYWLYKIVRKIRRIV